MLVIQCIKRGRTANMYLLYLFIVLVLQECGTTEDTRGDLLQDGLDDLGLTSQGQNDLSRNKRFYNSENPDETRGNNINDQIKRLILEYIKKKSALTEPPVKLVTHVSKNANHSAVTPTHASNANHSAVTPTHGPNQANHPTGNPGHAEVTHNAPFGSTSKSPTHQTQDDPFDSNNIFGTHPPDAYATHSGPYATHPSPYATHPGSYGTHSGHYGTHPGPYTTDEYGMIKLPSTMVPDQVANEQVSMTLTDVQSETEFFECPVLEPLLIEYFKDFPSINDTIDKTDLKVDDFDKAIQVAVNLFVLFNDTKLASHKLTTDVARKILDQRVRCPATQYQRIIDYVVKDELHSILNANNKQYFESTVKLLSGNFPSVPMNIIHEITTTLTRVMHKGVFEELISLLEVNEFEELHGFLHQLLVTSKATFRNFTDGGISESQMFVELKQKFHIPFHYHQELYMCTPPWKVISAQQSVIKDRVKQFYFIERTGMLMGYTRKMISAMFSTFHNTPIQHVFIQLGHNTVDYMKTAAIKIQRYYEKMIGQDFDMTIKVLKDELDSEKFAVVVHLMKMMNIYPERNEPDVNQMKETIRKYLQHDIHQLSELVRLVRRHQDLSEEVKTGVLMIVQDLLMQKKKALKIFNDYSPNTQNNLDNIG